MSALAAVNKTQVADVQDMNASMMQVISNAASNPNVDIDKMERLLQMQERMDARRAEQLFNEALQAAQAAMPRIAAKAVNNQTNSKYAKLEDINTAITPVYTRYGFSLSFGTGECPHENWFRTTCRISHVSGHSRDEYYDLPMDDAGIAGKKNKTDVHGMASARSYARRYLTMMIFNLAVGGDDNDGNYQKPIPTINDLLAYVLANDSLGVYLYQRILQDRGDAGIHQLTNEINNTPDGFKVAIKENIARMNLEGMALYDCAMEALENEEPHRLHECLSGSLKKSRWLMSEYIGKDKWANAVALLKQVAA